MEILEKIKTLEIGVDFITNEDLAGFIKAKKDIGDLDDLKNELTEYFEDSINEDVIYYSVAIDYLKENDPSLKDSLALAVELGYTLDNINSEVLASLLKTQKNQKEFEDFLESDAVEEIFNLFYKKS